MALDPANYPGTDNVVTVASGREKTEANDGSASTNKCQGADHNEKWAEMLEVIRSIRGKVLSGHAGAIIVGVNRTGISLSMTTPHMVIVNDYDSTTGLPKIGYAAGSFSSYRQLAGLLVMEKGGDVDAVADDAICYVLSDGVAGKLNTSAWSADRFLWLANSGLLSETPVAGSPPVAYVVTSHATDGVLRIFAHGLGSLHIQHLGGMLNSILSPAQITGSEDDYNPTGLQTAGLLRLNSDAAYDITGIAAPTIHTPGRELKITNVGGFNLTLKNADAGSAAANRFALDADIILAPEDACVLVYDSVSSRWRCPGWQRTSCAVADKTLFFGWEQSNNSGDYRGKSIGSSSNGQTNFAIPDDFGSLVSLEMVGIISAQITAQNIDLASDYAGDGEDAQTHSEADAAFTVTSALANEMFFYDISSVFNSLAAGDVCGINVAHQTIGATIVYLFVKLVYTPT
jgi:hypothetical protein